MRGMGKGEAIVLSVWLQALTSIGMVRAVLLCAAKKGPKIGWSQNLLVLIIQNSWECPRFLLGYTASTAD